MPNSSAIPVLFFAMLCTVSANVAFAAGAGSDSYIDPLPKGKSYNVFVIGASMANQLATGLKWSLRKAPDLRILARSKPATGLVRDDVYNWLRVARDLVREENVHIAIVALGGNDRQDFYINGRRLKRFSLLWRAEYLKRATLFMNMLKEEGAAVYWVGLPIVRSKRMTRDYMRINSYLSDLADQNGVKFIDVSQKFRGKGGGYTAFGLDINKRRRRIRDRDGIHFSMAGARVLGEHVAKIIRKDVEAAGQRSRTTELGGTRKN